VSTVASKAKPMPRKEIPAMLRSALRPMLLKMSLETSRTILLLALVAILTGGGCGPSDAAPSDVGGRGGVGVGGQGPDQPLTPDGNGLVDKSKTGTTMIHGYWSAFADGDCPTPEEPGRDASTCSRLITPDESVQYFTPTVVQGIDLGMCVVGVAAKEDDDYFSIGVWIHLDLNLENDTALIYDAPAHGVTGFAFDIDSEPPPRGGLVVEPHHYDPNHNPTDDGNVTAYWGEKSSATSPVHAGHNEFRWSQVVNSPTSFPVPEFDPTQLLYIEFGSYTDYVGPKSVSFCIKNLTALRH
jgi:hypothetical protein